MQSSSLNAVVKTCDMPDEMLRGPRATSSSDARVHGRHTGSNSVLPSQMSSISPRRGSTATTQKRRCAECGIPEPAAWQRGVTRGHARVQVAQYIRKAFVDKYNGVWHCIVGRNFGSYVTHETKHFIYFYLGQVAILLFKSG